jgi:exosortase/archaeosortase family protein
VAAIRRRRAEWAHLWPAAALVITVVAAYHFTLKTIFDYLWLDTPLAYLPLLPICAVGIAWVVARRYRGTPAPTRDRHIELAVGIPLLLVAAALVTIVPAAASTYYWTDRPDVLSLGFFAAGMTVLVFGTTWFWRVRGAFVFLFLTWPALYLHVLAGVLQTFTNGTNATLAAIVGHLPLGVTADVASGNVTVPQSSGLPLLINVGSACSGANSVLGFALIGAALLTLYRGGAGRKILWLVAGMVLAFTLNVGRLVSILLLARVGQPAFALGGYHAVIGLILFAVDMLVMSLLLRPFGLELRSAADDAGRREVKWRMPTVWGWRSFAAAGALVAATVFIAVANADLSTYAAFADGNGAPTVTTFGPSFAARGWSIYHEENFPWGTQYFGESSSFDRYIVEGPGTGVIYADVVLTDSQGTLDAYNLQNCFLFHNDDISTSQRMDLGNGVTGLLLNYADPSTHSRWASVSWAWPVHYKSQTYYERIELTSSPQEVTANPGSVPVADGLRGFFIDLINGITGNVGNAKSATLYQRADRSLEASAAVLVERGVTGAKA